MVDKHGLLPQPETLQYQLVDWLHYTEPVVKATDEQWGRDMLTHRRWAQWVENDLLERLRRDGPEQTKPKPQTRGALREYADRVGGSLRTAPAEALAFLRGVELAD